MNPASIEEIFTRCPYCGERISLLIEPQSIGQGYIEDCEVCCRPISVLVTDDQDDCYRVCLRQENDAL